jgi:uncharacterized protein YdeI (YjbR/CyaY-like superfamily)
MARAELEQVQIESLELLRAWLADQHQRGTRRGQAVWLVTFKKRPGAPHVPYSDIVDELLCWGWIDSQVRKLDEVRSQLLIAPRRRGSSWSKVNKDKVERLIAAGRIQAPGLDVIRQAQADGSWFNLDQVETLAEPPDLAAALDANPTARTFWDRFPPSSRRGILEWVHAAKRPETRAARIAETVVKAAENRKANFPAGRDAGPRPPG